MSKKVRIVNATAMKVEVSSAGSAESLTILEPGEAYLAPNSSSLLAKDEHSSAALEITPSAERADLFVITDLDKNTAGSRQAAVNVDDPQAQAALKSVEVKFTNKTDAVVEIRTHDVESEDEVFVTQLRPYQTYAAEGVVDQVWNVCLFITGTEIMKFVASDADAQSVDIQLRSRNSDISKTLTLSNESPMPILIEWVDMDNKRKRTQLLSPEKSVQLDTFASHVWLVRDPHSGLVLDACLCSVIDQTFVFDGRKLLSLSGGAETTIEFANTTGNNIRLVRTSSMSRANFERASDGEQDALIMVAGERVALKSRAGHVWQATRSTNGELLTVFVAKKERVQLCRIIEREKDGSLPHQIHFKNECGADVEIVGVIENSNEEVVFFREFPHRAEFSQPAMVAKEWRVREPGSAHILERIIPTPEEYHHTIKAASIVSEKGTKSVSLNIKNSTPFTMEISWVDYDGKEEVYYTIAPKASKKIETLEGYAWRIRERETGDLYKLVIVTSESEQEAHIVLKPIHSREKVDVRFENKTGLTLELLRFKEDGTFDVPRVLIPGYTANYHSFSTHAWALRDVHSETVLGTLIANKNDKLLSIANSSIRSKRSDRSVRIHFHNDMPFPVDLYWIDFDGIEIPHETLLPGERLEKVSYTTQPWRFRHSATASEVGVFLPTNEGVQDYKIGLRTYENDPTTENEIEFRNRTSLDLQVVWYDQKGHEKIRGRVLEARQSVKVKTNATYPWVLKDTHSGEAVAFTIAGNRAQTVYIDGDQIRSIRTEKPVWIEYTNNLNVDVDLYWVDFDGFEVKQRTLRAGQSARMGTFPSHVWRARLSDISGSEIDLFISGTEYEQKRDLSETVVVLNKQRKDGELWPGEVALFSRSEFKGDVRITNSDLVDLSLHGFEKDGVSSLKVAQDTAVTVFEDSYFNNLKGNRAEVADQVKSAAKDSVSTIINDFVEKFAGILPTIEIGTKKEKIPAPDQVSMNNVANRLRNDELGNGLIADRLSGAARDAVANNELIEDREELGELIERNLQRVSSELQDEINAAWKIELGEDKAETYSPALGVLTKILSAAVVRLNAAAVAALMSSKTAVFHNDQNDLTVSSIGNDNISSLRVFSLISPETLNISTTSKLTDDPVTENVDGVLKPVMIKGKDGRTTTKSKSVYRTTISFPPEVQEVQISAFENQEIRTNQNPDQTIAIGPLLHTSTPDNPNGMAQLKPNRAGQIVIQIEPTKIGVSTLRVRTNTMDKDSWFLVFPDADVHRKIIEMDDGALWNNQDQIKLKSTKREDVDGVENVMRSLSKTARPASNSSAVGVSSDRKLVAGRMDMSAFRLEFGNVGEHRDGSFRPVDPEKVNSLVENADYTDDQLGEFFSALEEAWDAGVDAVSVVVDEVVDVVEDIGEAVVDTVVAAAKWVEERAEDIGDALEEGFADALDAFEDAGEWIEDTAETVASEIVDTIEDAAEFVDTIASAIEQGVEQGLKLVVEAAGKVYAVAIDTIEKVGRVVQKIVETVVEAIESVIDFLASLFAWGDILESHDTIFDMLDDGIATLDESIVDAYSLVDSGLDWFEKEKDNFFLSARSSLGVDELPKEESEADTSEAMDMLNWLLGKITNIPQPSDIAQDQLQSILPTLSIPLTMSYSSAFVEEAESVSRKLKDKSFDLMDEASDLMLSFMDGLIETLDTLKSDPHSFPAAVGSLMLGSIEIISEIAFEIVDTFVDIFFDIARLGLSLVQSVVFAELDVPFISDLYEGLTGSKLTIGSLVSLIVAIPSTILSKLIVGENILAADRLGELTWEEFQKSPWRRWIFGIINFLLTLFNPIIALKDYKKQKKESPKKKASKKEGLRHKQSRQVNRAQRSNYSGRSSTIRKSPGLRSKGRSNQGAARRRPGAKAQKGIRQNSGPATQKANSPQPSANENRFAPSKAQILAIKASRKAQIFAIKASRELTLDHLLDFIGLSLSILEASAFFPIEKEEKPKTVADWKDKIKSTNYPEEEMTKDIKAYVSHKEVLEYLAWVEWGMSIVPILSDSINFLVSFNFVSLNEDRLEHGTNIGLTGLGLFQSISTKISAGFLIDMMRIESKYHFDGDNTHSYIGFEIASRLLKPTSNVLILSTESKNPKIVLGYVLGTAAIDLYDGINGMVHHDD